ncbi:MAG: ectoine synthase [Acidimicrobiales bacterium]
MKIRHLHEIDDTEADVRADTWRSRRLLLARDGMGFSVHDTVLYAGTTTEMHYANHLEAVYCIEGHAEIEDLATGERHEIRPGTLYALDDHDRHVLRAIEDFRCVCVFNPPVTGREVHDENGVYPLLTDGPADGHREVPA